MGSLWDGNAPSGLNERLLHRLVATYLLVSWSESLATHSMSELLWSCVTTPGT